MTHAEYGEGAAGTLTAAPHCAVGWNASWGRWGLLEVPRSPSETLLVSSSEGLMGNPPWFFRTMGPRGHLWCHRP